LIFAWNGVILELEGGEEKMDENRHPITCKNCGLQMIFGNEVLRSPRNGSVYLKFVCPHRSGEAGCGKVRRVRFEREPKQRFRRTKANNFFLVMR
jgi:hypothetical protein